MKYNNKRKTKRPKLTAELKINTIKFFKVHGLAATKSQYELQYNVSISSSTIYSWRVEVDRYDNHGMLITGLYPKSRRPKRCRVSTYDPRISEEIIRLRHSYQILGKDKLYQLLIPFCKANGIC